MYKIIVPLMNRSVTKETRDTYLRQFKKAKADRIFLALAGYSNDSETDMVMARQLKENVDFFRKEGIEAGVWIDTIGHGADLSFDSDFTPSFSKFTKMKSLSGTVREFVFCPLDKNFRERIATYAANLATSGTKSILLDDDFRISHGVGYYCACDLHMARIRELCGEDISREDLEKAVFHSKTNKYRDAWLTAQKESLEIMAQDIRDAVDKVDPDVRVSFCTVITHFGIDGSDPIKLTNILTGKSAKPLIRLSGAPYWSVFGDAPTPMISVIETARLLAYFCKTEGLEMIAEGDTYPRPRYNVPASILEIFDAALRADGQYDGLLKYMIDYNSSAEYETSYLTRHEKNLPIMDEICEMFDGKQALGVNVTCGRNSYEALRRNADFEISRGAQNSPYPIEGTMMGFNGISTVHGDGGLCRAVFGENARNVDLSLISGGAIIDGLAAEILTQRGIDVGLASEVSFEDKKALYLTDSDGKEKAVVHPSDVRYMKTKLCKNANIVAKIAFKEGSVPFAYTYENSDGARFLVLALDATMLPKNAGMNRGYMQQQILKEGIEWISGKKLPAFIERCPGLYLISKGGDGKMATALFNIYADSVDEGVVELDGEYSNIRFVNCSGRLEGSRVIIDSLPAYSFAAFEVS